MLNASMSVKRMNNVLSKFRAVRCPECEHQLSLGEVFVLSFKNHYICSSCGKRSIKGGSEFLPLIVALSVYWMTGRIFDFADYGTRLITSLVLALLLGTLVLRYWQKLDKSNQ